MPLGWVVTLGGAAAVADCLVDAPLVLCCVVADQLETATFTQPVFFLFGGGKGSS